MSTKNDFREVLYTIDTRGRRKWVYTKEITGYFRQRRNVVAAVLLLLYLALPWISVNGQQAVHLDLINRKFIFFGAIFWATDTRFLVFILAILAVSLFFFTTLFGRVWCGWACPQTIFMEFVFRPIERLIEGNSVARLKLDSSPWSWRKFRIKGCKFLAFSLLAWIMANTALAYFIGREPLLAMMQQSPFEHLSTFALSSAVMALLLFEFGYFREQFCTVVCPYARFQSVLMDDSSLVVGYDARRGEPRGKARDQSKGDCIDCGLCVRVCPTGIDIRNGLQMECVQCTACIDACDSVMERLDRPLGLIRYDSEKGLKDGNFTLLRPRTYVYGGILILLFSTLAYLLAVRTLNEVSIFRTRSEKLFTVLTTGEISNQIELHVENKSNQARRYQIESLVDPRVKLALPLNPFPVGPDSAQTIPVFVTFPEALLRGGEYQLQLRVSEGGDFEKTLAIDLLGPG